MKPGVKSFRIKLAEADSKKPADLQSFEGKEPKTFVFVPDESCMNSEVVTDLQNLYALMKTQLERQEMKAAKPENSKSQWELSSVLDMPAEEMRAFIHRSPCDFIFMLRQMFTYIAGFNDKDANLASTLNRLVDKDETGYNFVVAELERNTVDLKKVRCRFYQRIFDQKTYIHFLENKYELKLEYRDQWIEELKLGVVVGLVD